MGRPRKELPARPSRTTRERYFAASETDRRRFIRAHRDPMDFTLDSQHAAAKDWDDSMGRAQDAERLLIERGQFNPHTHARSVQARAERDVEWARGGDWTPEEVERLTTEARHEPIDGLYD